MNDNDVFYLELLDNLKHLRDNDDGEDFLGSLAVISQLMIEMLDPNRLKGATYNREFKHTRINLKVDIGVGK